MNIEITTDRKNPLLNRRDLEIEIRDFNETPSKKELMQLVSSKTGVEAPKILIRNIKQQFGKTNAIAYIKIYEDVESLNKFERKHLINRKSKLEEKPAEEEKKEEAPAVEPVAEAAEEKVKEPKVEEKKEEPKEEIKKEKVEEKEEGEKDGEEEGKEIKG